jgi:hypothetical protein
MGSGPNVACTFRACSEYPDQRNAACAASYCSRDSQRKLTVTETKVAFAAMPVPHGFVEHVQAGAIEDLRHVGFQVPRWRCRSR